MIGRTSPTVAIQQGTYRWRLRFCQRRDSGQSGPFRVYLYREAIRSRQRHPSQTSFAFLELNLWNPLL